MKAAQKGRTHDRTRPCRINLTNTLAKTEPSTHDPSETSRIRKRRFFGTAVFIVICRESYSYSLTTLCDSETQEAETEQGQRAGFGYLVQASLSFGRAEPVHVIHVDA